MRTKSLVAPANPKENDEWLSPEGHSTRWHRAWDGESWIPTAYEEMNPESLDAEEDVEEENQDEGEDAGSNETGEKAPDAEETEGDVDEEEDDDEQSVQAAIPNGDGGEQGTSGKPSPEPKQRGKREKLQPGRKGDGKKSRKNAKG